MTRALRAFQNWSPIAHKQSNFGGCTCGCFSHLGHVVFLLAGPELDTHKETMQLHWQLVCASWLIHDQSSKMPRGTHGLVVETSSTETARDSGQNKHVDVINMVKATKFRFARHVARLLVTDIVHRVLKVRHLAWWPTG